MIDKNIFEKCRKNDAQAQRLLYESFKARLMGLCRRYTRNREDAQDILQESFIKIFVNIKRVETEAKLESWMKSVTVRTAIDHYHKSRKNDMIQYSETEYEISDNAVNLLVEELSDEFLIALISELPEGCRMVFNLCEVEGYNHTEIAGIMN